MKTFRVMLKTELKLSLRGMDMLIFAIIMPLVVLLIIGMIFGGKPAFEGAEYTFLDQSFGALATISICAGGVMGLPLVVSDIKTVPGDTGQSRHDFNSAGGYLHVVFGHIADTFISYCQHVFWISDARKLCTFFRRIYPGYLFYV